jgi:hypothetical protein
MLTLMQSTFADIITTVTESKTWDKLSASIQDTWIEHLDEAMGALANHNELTFRSEETQTFTINHYYEETLLKIKAQAKAINDAPADQSPEAAQNMQAQTEAIEQQLEVDTGFIARYAKGAKKDAQSMSVLELQVSLHCYSKVLTKRLFDSVALMARDMLVIQPHIHLSEIMQSSISDDDLQRALAEDGATTKKRMYHENALARLVEAQQKLGNF